ncbi:mucin-2 protein [Nocardioides caeni]|uniref:Mucin-2 protein n=1 Tax=Nocardioides caeni TaxID=574700 RepID=A0A4S8NL58_9ACTN|nr:mucin-2 protein [Nocardioides caeni]THV17608.1 mucin-2 protein [Nocardioides caeni]
MATSHKRETARRTPRAALLAGSLAALATSAVVSTGVMNSAAPEADLLAVDATKAAGSVADAGDRSRVTLSRGGSGRRAAVTSPLSDLMAPDAVAKAVESATKKRWTTEALNLWTTPGDKARKVGEIADGERVLVTGRSFGERVEIVVAGKARWVTEGYLTDEKPPTLGGDCTNGTSVPSGVSENIKKVHAAVCAAFPEITTYGTFRGDGEHSQGIAVDIMVSGDRGWEIAEFIRANYQALGVSYLIYSQQIWSVERSGEGWRGMSDRGSATANHYDHVHVTTY